MKEGQASIKKEPAKKKGLRPKAEKGLKIAGNVFFWSLIAFVLSFPVVSLIDRNTNYGASYLGYRLSVVVSPSMANRHPENGYLTDEMSQIQVGDVILTKDYGSYEEIALYDVLTHVTDAGLICHRVVDLYEDGGNKWIVTRGDANNADDAPFAFDSVRGKVISILPGGNGFSLYLDSAYAVLGVSGSIFFIALGLYIAEGAKEKKKGRTPLSDKKGGQK